MHLLGLKIEQGEVLSALQKTGVVEIIDIVESTDEQMMRCKARVCHELTKELSDLETKLDNLGHGIDFCSLC